MPKPVPPPLRTKRRKRGDFIRQRLDGSFYNDAALEPSNHIPNQRWRIDFDYLPKLSEAEREWLADFTAAHYDADFRRAPKEDWPQDARRAADRAKWAARNDHYAYLETGGRLRDIDAWTDGGARRYEIPDLPGDERPAPDYLDAEPYRHARDYFRTTLAPVAGQLPKPTPQHLRALARLRAVTPDLPISIQDSDHAPDPDPVRKQVRKPRARRKARSGS